MQIHKISKLAYDCSTNNVTAADTKHENLIKFNEYYSQNAFDSILVDSQVDGNCLLFGLMYIYHKLNVKTNLPEIKETIY